MHHRQESTRSGDTLVPKGREQQESEKDRSSRQTHDRRQQSTDVRGNEGGNERVTRKTEPKSDGETTSRAMNMHAAATVREGTPSQGDNATGVR